MGSLYGALILMSLVSLNVYENHLKNEYRDNLRFIAESLEHLTSTEIKNKNFNTCNTQSQKMCTLCTLNNDFASVNVDYFTRKEDIKHKPYEKILQLKDGSYIQLSMSKKYIESQLNNMRYILFYVFLIISVLFTFIVYFLHKKLFSPLKCLVKCCHDLENGKKTTPQCPSDSYEIQELREAILDLLKKNQSLYEKKHDMFKEITHQLKSPIAIMQARLSSLTEETSPDALTQYVKETNTDIEDIKELIHELLFLEEVKLDIENSSKSIISMKSVFEDMQKKFKPLLELNQITIDADWQQDFSIYSFKQPILQVIQAMYENVSVHTKKGTTIGMTIDAAKKTLIISNIPKEEEDNLFKSTNIGTKIIKRLSDELDFTVHTEHHKNQYITMITFHS